MAVTISGTDGITTPQINAGNIVGEVGFFARSTAPEGWLKANGAAVSRTTFADLFAEIGTTYGAGDGSTTFALPDMRGEFPRGFDDGRGVDSGRSFGTAQMDQMQRMTGSFQTVVRSSQSGSILKSGTGALSTPAVTRSRRTFEAPTSFTQDNADVAFNSGDSPSARTSATTDGETRSRNVALLACIKF